MGDLRKLEVWQRARLLSLRVYQVTRPFPSSERYGITAQMRGASVSILSNLAEGSGQRGDGELSRFLSRAQGSAAELECQTLLARDLGYTTTDEAGEILAEVETIRRMLTRLAQRVNAARNAAIRRPRSANSS